MSNDKHSRTDAPQPPQDVSDTVKQGGTRPGHAGKDDGDRSPHDADRKRPTAAIDPKQGEAGLDRDTARRDRDAAAQERDLSIDSEARGEGKKP